MPFTPFHFGPSALISLPLKRYIDVPCFILANVAIDIEPLLVMNLDLKYPLHGYAHTMGGALIIGPVLGIILYIFKKQLEHIMTRIFKLNYSSSLFLFITSGILGCLFHVLLDSPLYTDIRPFFPFNNSNPFLGIVGNSLMYKVCLFSFFPAIVLYYIIVKIESKQKQPYNKKK